MVLGASKDRCVKVSKRVLCVTSCQQLWRILNDPIKCKKTRIVDATLGEMYSKGNHIQRRIASSKFFDIDKCSDKSTDVPRMLPTSEEFSRFVSTLNISNDHHIIVYDDGEKNAVYSSARLWWMFRVFGHDEVSVLDGGLKSWISEGYPVVSGDYGEKEKWPAMEKTFVTKKRERLLKTIDFMKENAFSQYRIKVIDTREEEEFLNGHIPHSLSLPYTEVSNADGSKLKRITELRQMFSLRGMDLNEPFVVTCRTGNTACIIALSAYFCGKEDVAVYDGSWMEWSKYYPGLVVKEIVK